MRARWPSLCLAVLALSVTAQAQRGVPQTTFGAETPIKRRVAVPREVIRQIAEADPDLANRCGADMGRSLGASALDINGDGVSDLVVQGTAFCAMGAHATNFWVFSKTRTRFGTGFDLVLSTAGDGMQVTRRPTNAYRDIESSYYTALEAYSTVWKFDGSKYQPRECFIEDFKTRRRQRTTCNAQE